MKLVLDENLSRKIIPVLQAAFPGSSDVSLLELEQADDRKIWDFAKTNDYVIVTKDDDFQALLALFGPPPQIIRLRMGNCGNQQVIAALTQNAADIAKTLSDPEIGLVELF